MNSVAVIGIGETKMGKHINRSLRDLISEAGEKAILDAGIDRKSIKAAYIGNFNGAQMCNQSHFGPLTSEVLDLGNIATFRTEAACASGSEALRLGYLAVMSGIYDIVLVGGVEKMTHQTTEVVTSGIATAMDQDLEVMAGLTFPANFAMMANRYFYEYRNIRREMAMCAVIAHHNGCLNPDAQMQKEITIEKVLEAAPIADPLTVFDCSLITDGAAFAVLASTEVAKKLGKHRVVEIVGSGHAGDTLTLSTKKSLTGFAASQYAAKQAYDQAGMTPKDINFAEVHDCFTITQIIDTEDLGFFEKGKGADGVYRGDTTRDGIIPINVSGGLKAKGHPIGGTGISQIYEVVTQIRGDAGARQLKRSDIGLTHNMGGSAGVALVHILKGWS